MADSFNTVQAKLGGETPNRIRAWCLIHNKKTIVLFEKTAMQLSC
jgi:hypothetical protein